MVSIQATRGLDRYQLALPSFVPLSVTQVYTRHCVLAAQKLGEEAHRSFLDDTFLADRKTTLRAHLEDNPHVMAAVPPKELLGRYSG